MKIQGGNIDLSDIFALILNACSRIFNDFSYMKLDANSIFSMRSIHKFLKFSRLSAISQICLTNSIEALVLFRVNSNFWRTGANLGSKLVYFLFIYSQGIFYFLIQAIFFSRFFQSIIDFFILSYCLGLRSYQDIIDYRTLSGTLICLFGTQYSLFLSLNILFVGR